MPKFTTISPTSVPGHKPHAWERFRDGRYVAIGWLLGVRLLVLARRTKQLPELCLGLGLGSLVGGELSRRCPRAALKLFAGAELGIGLFGVFSLALFSRVATATLDETRLTTGTVTFLLVLVPTMLMGATLPLLVGHATRLSGNVGKSVGSLYFVNTLGAALGSLAAAGVFLGVLGLRGTVVVAAALNFAIAVIVWRKMGGTGA